MGIRAMEKLLDLIAGKTLIHQQDILNYELIIRESSGEYIGTALNFKKQEDIPFFECLPVFSFL